MFLLNLYDNNKMEYEQIASIQVQLQRPILEPRVVFTFLNQHSKRKSIYLWTSFIFLAVAISTYFIFRKSRFQEQIDEQTLKKLAVLIPHDTSCSTQGLSFINSTHLLESCGLYQRSYFHILQYTRTTDHESSIKETFKSEPFGQQYFLKGSVYFPKNNMIYIMSWREQIVFRYDAATLKEVDRLPWKRAGWGLTHNNSHLIISDGSSSLFIVNQRLDILQEIQVISNDSNGRAYSFSQLQWVKEKGKQYVFANVLTKKDIVKIDLNNGSIASQQKFKALAGVQARQGHFQEMNGIAYNGKSYLLTGKEWGSFYQIQTM